MTFTHVFDTNPPSRLLFVVGSPRTLKLLELTHPTNDLGVGVGISVLAGGKDVAVGFVLAGVAVMNPCTTPGPSVHADKITARAKINNKYLFIFNFPWWKLLINLYILYHFEFTPNHSTKCTLHVFTLRAILHLTLHIN